MSNYEFVDHPSHYNKPGEKETWEKMHDIWGSSACALWCTMTAFKYADRIGCKPGEDVARESDKIKAYLSKAEEFRIRAEQEAELSKLSRELDEIRENLISTEEDID